VFTVEKIAFLFPGQGSQYVGMSKSLYDQYDIARLTFEEANDTVGFDLAKLCFEGSLADLGKVENALIALLTVSVVSFRVYMKEIGVTPQFCAGHSLGEYSALTCSGAMKFSDALKIVSLRSKIALEWAEKVNGAMTIVDGLGPEQVEEVCKEISAGEKLVAISCYNSSNQVTLSGNLEAVQRVEDKVLELGGQTTPLLGNPPFHCPVMQPAAEQLGRELQKYTFNYLRYPVIANVTAAPYDGPEQIIPLLQAQMVRPVKWRQIMSYLNKYGITMTIEMGSKNVLSGLVKQSFENINPLAFDQKEDRKALVEYFPNNPMYKKHIPTVVTKCLAIAVATPNHNFDNDQYQKGVVEPYSRLRAIQDEIETKGAAPTEEQMREALKLLQGILKTKKVDAREQQEWYDEILEETGTRYLFPDIQIPA
jgi:[acyl-carrier-protein] S-malonyltransferase